MSAVGTGKEVGGDGPGEAGGDGARHAANENGGQKGPRRREVVGARGFEPPTPCTPCRCATGLRHAPTLAVRMRTANDRTVVDGAAANKQKVGPSRDLGLEHAALGGTFAQLRGEADELASDLVEQHLAPTLLQAHL